MHGSINARFDREDKEEYLAYGIELLESRQEVWSGILSDKSV